MSAAECYLFLAFDIKLKQHMAQTQLATRVDERVKRAVEAVCEARGLKMNRFIEDALVDKLEELEDIEDLKAIRCEPTLPLGELVKDLGLDDEL